MIVAVAGQPPADRIVVVSPHFDDGVLSLGASIAAWSRAGATVVLLTVFGCDPDSTAPSGGWDRRGGFGTEGESARARREEDRLACAVLGASPVPLPFGSVDYERHGDDAAVQEAVTRRADDARPRASSGITALPPGSRMARSVARRRSSTSLSRALRRAALHAPDLPRAASARHGAAGAWWGARVAPVSRGAA